MLFNTSYKNEDYVKEVNRLLGKSYPFIRKTKNARSRFPKVSYRRAKPSIKA